MAEDTVLKVGAEFDVSPIIAGTQKAVTAFNTLGRTVQQLAAEFQAEGLSEDSIAAELEAMGVNATEAQAAIEGLGTAVAEVDPQIMLLQTQVNQLTERLEALKQKKLKVAGAAGTMRTAMGAARVEMGAFEGSTGMMAGGLARVAAMSSSLAPIIADIFPIFAAGAFIAILTQVIEEFGKASDAIMGYTEEVKKAEKENVSFSDKALEQARSLADANHNLASANQSVARAENESFSEKYATAARDHQHAILDYLGPLGSLVNTYLALSHAEADVADQETRMAGVARSQMINVNEQLAEADKRSITLIKDRAAASEAAMTSELARTRAQIEALDQEEAKQRDLARLQEGTAAAKSGGKPDLAGVDAQVVAEYAAKRLELENKLSVDEKKLSDDRKLALIEDEKEVGAARVNAEKQTTEELRALGQITADQEASQLHIQETELYSIEANAMNARMDLLKTEGADKLHEIDTLQGQLEALSIEHETKQKEITAKAAEEDRKAMQQLAKGLQEDFLRALDEKAKAFEEEQKQELADELEGYKAQIEIARSGATTIAEANRAMYDERREDIEKYREVAIAEAEEEYQKVVQIYEQEAAALREKARKGVITEEEASKQIKAIYADEGRAYQQMALQIEKTNQQMYQKIQTEAQQTWKKTTQELNSAFNQWITGQQTLGAAMAKFWDQLVLKAIDSIATIGENWALGLVTQGLAAEKSVLISAKDAAAKAWSSAPNPIIGAVEAAATFTAIVAAYTPTFEHGGVVPGAPGAPVGAVVHAGERVLTPLQNTNFERIANSTTNNGGNVTHRHTTININHQGTNMTDKDISRSVREALRKGQLQGLDV